MNNEAKSSHIITIMRELLSGGTSTAIDAKASNRNQYYGTIKKQGIELVEVYKTNASKGSN